MNVSSPLPSTPVALQTTARRPKVSSCGQGALSPPSVLNMNLMSANPSVRFLLSFHLVVQSLEELTGAMCSSGACLNRWGEPTWAKCL